MRPDSNYPSGIQRGKSDVVALGPSRSPQIALNASQRPLNGTLRPAGSDRPSWKKADSNYRPLAPRGKTLAPDSELLLSPEPKGGTSPYETRKFGIAS